jgi:hypothetical protein
LSSILHAQVNEIYHHHHHKHQGLDPLIRSVSRVTTALANEMYTEYISKCRASEAIGVTKRR